MVTTVSLHKTVSTPFVTYSCTMVVDKFGRHQSTVSVRRETKRQLRESVGFKITDDGHIDVENKKIRNLATPATSYDAVPLHFVHDRCVLLPEEQGNSGIDMKGYRLHNVDTPLDDKDATNKVYVDDTCLRYVKSTDGDPVINARDHNIISVKAPTRDNDAANKYYVDKKVIQRDKRDNLLIGHHRIMQVDRPQYDKDVVNLEFMKNSTVSLRGDAFSANGKKITNMADGDGDTHAVSVRQLYDFKQDAKSELHRVVKILQMRIEKVMSYIYKLHAHTIRSSLDGEESELKARDNAETRNLIKQLDKMIITDDWRTLF